MKKACRKITVLILTICVLCSQLILTARAADTGAEASPENVLVVTEDTSITGAVDVLVLVDAPVRVDVTDAQLTAGLFISPDAEGAVVSITGETSVKEIVVASAAIVAVDKIAAVETVTVDAPSAEVEVSGTVKTITVHEAAESASIVVSEGAHVFKLEVAAPGVRAEVAGSVKNIAVFGTADSMELAVSGTAAVTTITDNTGRLTVSGPGADRVTVTDASTSPEKASIPERPETPAAPVTPEEPGTSEEPETPEEPGTSEEPETPEEPGTSEEPETPEEPGTSEEPETPEGPEIPEEPETPEPDDGGSKGDDASGTGNTISWGTIDGSKNGIVSADGSAVSISGEIEKTTVNQTEGYWVGFCVSEGYTVALKPNIPAQDPSSSLAPVIGDEDGFVYFAIDTFVSAAIDEAAENVEKEDEERTIWITGTVQEEAGLVVTVTNTSDGSAEDVSVTVSVNVTATEKRTIPAEEVFDEDDAEEYAAEAPHSVDPAIESAIDA